MSGTRRPGLIAVLLLLSFAMAGMSVLEGGGVQDAFAMGQAPASCPNLYHGNFTSFAITYPTSAGPKSFYPTADPNGTFTLNNGQSYQVGMVIHSASLSTAQNTANGSVWYSSDWPGSGLGVCVLNAHADEDITVDVNVTKAADMNPVGNSTQSVGWTTTGAPQVAYNVVWVQPSSATSTTAHTSTTSSSPSSSTSSTPAVSTTASTALVTTRESVSTSTITTVYSTTTSAGVASLTSAAAQSTSPATTVTQQASSPGTASSLSSSSSSVAVGSSNSGAETTTATAASQKPGGDQTLLVAAVAGVAFLSVVGYYALRRNRW